MLLSEIKQEDGTMIKQQSKWYVENLEGTKVGIFSSEENASLMAGMLQREDPMAGWELKALTD